MEVMVHLLGCTGENQLVLPAVVYANKYIRKTQATYAKHQIFTLLLISTLVTVKYWQDGSVSLTEASRFYGIPKNKIVELEKRFLSTIDYSLYMSPSEADQVNMLENNRSVPPAAV